jgi:hypothetical protein
MDVGMWLRNLGQLNAEDWRNLVNAYLDAAAGSVIGLGGA